MHQPLMGMMTTPVFVDGVEVGDFVEGGVPVFYVGFQLLLASACWMVCVRSQRLQCSV